MKHLLTFRILCVALQVVCCVALYIEIFVNDIGSLTAVYVWAGLMLVSLAGNIAGTILSSFRKS